MKGLLKKVGIGLLVLIVLGVVFGNGKDKSDEPTVQPATEAVQAQESAEPEDSSAEEETSGQDEEAAEEAPAEATDRQHLAIGDSVSFNDGTTVVLNEVEGGLKDYDGDPVTRINVTYINDGSDSISFNSFDWDGEDANGVQRGIALYLDANNELNSGNLSAGGTVSGNVYLEGDLVRVIYQNNIFLESTQVGWDVQ